MVKVDELMALCDQLELNLAIGEVVRRDLLDALLHEAVLPDNGIVSQIPVRLTRTQDLALSRHRSVSRITKSMGSMVRDEHEPSGS